MLLGESLVVLAAAVITVIVSSTLQATIGFGLALLSIPALNIIGFDSIQAISISSIAMILQMSNGLRRLRNSVETRNLVWRLIIVCASMVVGVLILHLTIEFKPDLARQFTGGVVIAAVITIALTRPTLRQNVGTHWTILALSLSGFLAGTTGMGGTPMALWGYAHDWPPEKIRATIWSVSLPATILLMALLLFTFSSNMINTLALSALISPFAIVGSTVGLFIAQKMSVHWLRTAAFAVLLVIGVSVIMQPLL